MNFTFLPLEWNVTKLGDVAEVLDPQPDHRTPPEVLDGIPYIGVNDFLPTGEIDIKSCRKVSKEVWAKQQADILIDEGGIIFGKIGTIGLPKLLLKSNIKYALSANVVLIKPRINTFFVLYWLKSEHIARQIYRTLHTTSQPALGIIKIRQLMIVSPPLAEQCKIAEILSSWDKAIALLEQLITAKRKLKQGLMQQLLTGKKRFKEFEPSQWNMIPEGWSSTKLLDLSSNGLMNGAFNDPKLVGTGYKLINVVNLYSDPYIKTTELELLNLPSSDYEKFKAKKGDIFFTRSSLKLEGIAHCNIFLDNRDDVIFECHIIRVRPNLKKVYPRYLHYYCVSPNARKHFMSYAKTTTMTTIDQNGIGSLTVLLPPLPEQQKIASILSTADAEISNLEKQLAAYKQQKRGLMQQLLTGKKRVKLNEPQMQKV